jgi:hypothetical protein
MTMFFFISVLDQIGGNGAKAYVCGVCGGLMTRSDQLLLVNGQNRHFFVNPAGMECDFYTFSSCPGAMALGEATETHTWFSGYGWRMAFCTHCGQHMGWHYEAVSALKRPVAFWGILVSHLKTVENAEQGG